MATVTLKNIEKSYGDVQIIKGVDLQVDDREFCVFVGPSGCGKSTLLRMVAGLEEITAGDIAIGGRVVNRVPPKDRDIAMVFQNYALYPHMTVRQNMAFSLKLAKAAQSLIDERVGRAASILGLEVLLDRYPRQLSGGQRQTVAIARSLLLDPKVILLDEPTAALGVAQTAEVLNLIERVRDRGLGVVMISHNMEDVRAVADRIVVLRLGKNNGIFYPDTSNQELVSAITGASAACALAATGSAA